MRLILLFSNLKLTEYLLSHHNKLKTHAMYFQFHFISFFLLINLFNLKYNNLLIISIIFLVGEVFLVFNYVYNKNNLKRYLLNANFLLYGIRISLILLSLVFDNKDLYKVLFYILIICISIYKPLFQINLLNKELKFNNFLGLFIFVYIIIVFSQFLPSENYLLFSLTFLVAIFASTYTFGFKRLVYLFDVKINKSESRFYKKELEERKLFIDLIEYNNDFVGIKVDKDFKLINCYSIRKTIKDPSFYLILIYLIVLIVSRTHPYFNVEISNKHVLFIIMLLFLLTFGVILGVFVGHGPHKYQMLKSQNQLYLIINKNLNQVSIKKKENNKYYLGLDLYKVEVNNKKYHFLINSYNEL